MSRKAYREERRSCPLRKPHKIAVPRRGYVPCQKGGPLATLRNLDGETIAKARLWDVANSAHKLLRLAHDLGQGGIGRYSPD